MELSIEECLRRIGRLPHAAVINPDDALRWTQRTLGIDPERIGWHITRAGGIGGSESGTLVAWRYGDFHSRGSVEKMGKQKLLILPPDRANDDMSRGAFLEDHIRDIFELKMTRQGRQWRRMDAEKALVESGSHPDYPWLRASLDGLYEIDGKVTIVDFKSPSEDSLQEYLSRQGFHDYVAQLNHYALVAEGRGVRVDALELAMYDYRRVARVGCEVFPITKDLELQQKIINASSEFWHEYVGQGMYPEEERRPVLQADAGVPAEVDEAARRAVISKIIADKATKDYAADQKVVHGWVKETGSIGGGILPLGSFADGAEGFLQVKAEMTLDVESAVQRLRDLGMEDKDIEALREPDKYDSKKISPAYDGMLKLLARVRDAAAAGEGLTALAGDVDKVLRGAPVKEKGAFDEEKVIAALDSLGEVPYTYFTEKISSGLPRGKRQDLEERRAMVGSDVELLVGALAAREQAPEALPVGPVLAR